MKAKLTIEPGCEAGSLYCGECNGQYFDNDKYNRNADYEKTYSCMKFSFYTPFHHIIYLDLTVTDGGDRLNRKRCQECLDSEKAQKDFVKKSRIAKIIHSQEMNSWSGTVLVKKLARIVGKK